MSAYGDSKQVEFLQCPTAEPVETEHHRRTRLLDDVLEEFRGSRVGVDIGSILR